MKRNLNKIKDFLANPWVYTFGAGIFLYLVTTIVNSFIKDINFKDSFIGIAKTIGRVLYIILTFRIYVWILILVIIVFFFIILISAKLKSSNNILAYKDYRYIKYDEWLFTWDYSSSRNGIHINNLRPICMKCRCELSQAENRHWARNGGCKDFFYCPNCNEKYNYIYSSDNILGDIEKIIIYNLNNSKFDNFYNI
jgi:NOL1/NOP2/fmu family ribosome biogenesis protein